jgi:hypothetical protein
MYGYDIVTASYEINPFSIYILKGFFYVNSRYLKTILFTPKKR